MIKRNNKKGFTIVELVIVIAVIAILAAVLIPTFAGIIKKANESADIQAVRQMNTILAAEDAYKGGLTINDAVAALKEAGLNGDDYIALVTGRYFFYDATENRIVYAEYKGGNYTVIFPDDINTDGHSLLSLSGDVAKKDYAEPTVSGEGEEKTATFSISSAEEYAQLAADFKAVMDGDTVDALGGYKLNKHPSYKVAVVSGAHIVINLTKDIDLKGAAFNLNLNGVDFTLNGNGKTISGVVNNSGFTTSDNNTEHVLSEYGGGFIGVAINSNITFNDVTFKDCHFGNEKVKGSAVFVGQLSGVSSLTLNNTHVEKCTVTGSKGVAVYAGHVESESGNGTITFTGEKNTVNGCDLVATDEKNPGLVAIMAGRVSVPNLTISGTAPEVSNLTITNAGQNVASADSRWIACNSNKPADSDIVKEYNGSWSK